MFFIRRSTRRQNQPSRFRPWLEPLEDRTVLSANLTSTFDSGGAEGWDVEILTEGAGTAYFVWEATGGHPGGNIVFGADDPSEIDVYEIQLLAGPQYAGDLTRFAGGIIAMDLGGAASQGFIAFENVIFTAGDGQTFSATHSDSLDYGDGWVRWEWSVGESPVLGNVAQIQLVFRPEFGEAVYRMGFDNFLLEAGPNQPPAALPGGPYTVAEGSNVLLTGAGIDQDGDVEAYDWDLDNDGVFETPGQNVTFSAAARDGGSFQTVSLRVTDNEGASTTDTTTVTILNVAPTAGVDGPATGVRGQPNTFALFAGDPSLADRTAGFTYTIQWGDGNSQTIDPSPNNGTGFEVDHIYTTTGSYIVQVTATDKNLGISATVTRAITIEAAQVQDQTLVVSGTIGDDHIRITQQGRFGNLQVRINGALQGVFSGTNRIVVFGQAGNDEIQVAGNITIPAQLYGGAGHDRLHGGNGPNILLGGDGDDWLLGGSNRDVLIGGFGADRLNGRDGEDILLAGDLLGGSSFTEVQQTLGFIQDRWLSGNSYATRVEELSDYIRERATDDASLDVLIGGRERDWFFASLAGEVRDRIQGLRSNEDVVDLSNL